MMLLCFTLVACDDNEDGGDAGGEPIKPADTADKNDTDDKNEKPTIPDGYKLYDNGSISFAYPDDWSMTDGSTVILINPEGYGNNITVVYEAKNTIYDDMTVEDFNELLKPSFEAMGFSVSNPEVSIIKNKAGVTVTKMTYTATVDGISMQQTIFVTTANNRSYSITVTETWNDDELVETVFNTLNVKK